MSLVKFVIWFIVSLVGVTWLVSTIKNPFITGFLLALIFGFIMAKDND